MNLQSTEPAHTLIREDHTALIVLTALICITSINTCDDYSWVINTRLNVCYKQIPYDLIFDTQAMLPC